MHCTRSKMNEQNHQWIQLHHETSYQKVWVYWHAPPMVSRSNQLATCPNLPNIDFHVLQNFLNNARLNFHFLQHNLIIWNWNSECMVDTDDSGFKYCSCTQWTNIYLIGNFLSLLEGHFDITFGDWCLPIMSFHLIGHSHSGFFGLGCDKFSWLFPPISTDVPLLLRHKNLIGVQ